MRKFQAVAAGWLIVLAGATAQAGIVSHNGTTCPDPPQPVQPTGSGVVVVEICVVSFPNIYNKVFFVDATHILVYEFDPCPPLEDQCPPLLQEVIVNRLSDVAWDEFHIELLDGADFVHADGLPIPAGNPVGESFMPFLSASGATVDSSQIMREFDGPDLIKSSLWIVFADPVDRNGGGFLLTYHVDGPSLEFTMKSAPSPIETDTDDDGITDDVDNCPETANPLQEDFDSDGIGDVCDDSDGDGVPDSVDNCPAIANSGQEDFDGDGLGDVCDADDDNDGLLDATEVDIATAMGGECPNPLDADSDGDTISDGDEVAAGTNPCNADTDGDGVPDNIDPDPNMGNEFTEVMEEATRILSEDILDINLNLGLFNGPNTNVNAGRRNALANRATDAANAIAAGDIEGAIESLMSLLAKIDGQSPPPDWMDDSPEKTALAVDVVLLIALLLE